MDGLRMHRWMNERMLKPTFFFFFWGVCCLSERDGSFYVSFKVIACLSDSYLSLDSPLVRGQRWAEQTEETDSDIIISILGRECLSTFTWLLGSYSGDAITADKVTACWPADDSLICCQSSVRGPTYKILSPRYFKTVGSTFYDMRGTCMFLSQPDITS